MRKNRFFTTILSAIGGLFVGILLLRMRLWVSATDMFSVVMCFFGIIAILINLPAFIHGIINFRSETARLDLILSVVGLLFGIALIFDQRTVVVVIVAFYLILEPLIRVLVAKHKKEMLKKEIIKPIFGVSLLIALPFLDGAVDALFYLLLTIAGWVVIVGSVLYAVLLLVSVFRHKKKDGYIFSDTNGDGKIDTIFVRAEESTANNTSQDKAKDNAKDNLKDDNGDTSDKE